MSQEPRRKAPGKAQPLPDDDDRPSSPDVERDEGGDARDERGVDDAVNQVGPGMAPGDAGRGVDDSVNQLDRGDSETGAGGDEEGPIERPGAEA